MCTSKCLLIDATLKITIGFLTNFHLLFHPMVIFTNTSRSKYLEVHVTSPVE
jgi:hypothetical protein